MARFVGFKPEGMRKIASKMGYQGSMDDFDNYLQQNPEKKRQMIVYESMARQMAKGGVVKMQEGGVTQPASPRQLPQADVPVGTSYNFCNPGATGTAIDINLLTGAIAILSQR